MSDEEATSPKPAVEETPPAPEEPKTPLFMIGKHAIYKKTLFDITVDLGVLVVLLLATFTLDSTGAPSGWKLVLSLIPFVCVFQGILSFKLSSRYVAPFTLGMTMLIGLSWFRDSEYFSGDSLGTAFGKVGLIIADRAMWTLFEYAFNVFTAFFFLRVLQMWGIVESMREDFENLAPNWARKIGLTGFGFAVLLAVVAPGGSNFVIAGAILIKMNLLDLAEGSDEWKAANKRVGALCLFGNAITSAFNLMGVCIVALAEDILPLASELPDLNLEGLSEAEAEEYGQRRVGYWFSLLFFIFGIFSPSIMALIFSPAKGVLAKIGSIKGDLPILLTMGTVYSVVQWLVAGFLGPQLPCLLGGGAAMLTFALMQKFGDYSVPDVRKRGYALPFVLLIAILMVYQLVPAVKDILTGGPDPNFLNPCVFCVGDFERQFPYLFHPGSVVLLLSFLTPYLVDYKRSTSEVLAGAHGLGDNSFSESTHRKPLHFKDVVRKNMIKLAVIETMEEASMGARRARVIKSALAQALGEVLPVIVSITAFASIAKLMGFFEMTQSIALAIVNALTDYPEVYSLVIPIIGMLGSGLTGSSTTSNFLFARLQVRTSTALGIVSPTRNSVWKIGAAQLFGSTAGEIISPMNAVVITMMDGVGGVEADLVGILLPVYGLWLLCCCAITYAFVGLS